MAGGLFWIALFGFLAVVIWVGARQEEREAAQRHELYRRMLEQTGGADAVRALMEQESLRKHKDRIAGMKLGGMVTSAVGATLGVFLYYLGPNKPLYLLGLIPLSVGVILMISAFFTSPPSTATPGQPRT